MKKTPVLLILTLLPAFVLAKPNPDDPYETYNRFMYGINNKVDRFALKPVAKGYRAVTPGPVRRSVSNFFNNFRDVYSIASNILRADLKKAANDTMRVAINTTWGVGGLFDIASEAQMPNNKNTLGDTFASWGWKNSHYFVYPVYGPSTVRDAFGTTITLTVPGPTNAVFRGKYDPWGAAVINGVSAREQALGLTETLDEASLDPYSYTRDVYMGFRKNTIYGPTTDPENDNIDDLMSSDIPSQPDIFSVEPEALDNKNLPVQEQAATQAENETTDK